MIPDANRLSLLVSRKQIDNAAVPTANPLTLSEPFDIGHVHADWAEDGSLRVTLFEPNGVDRDLIESGQKAIVIKTRTASGDVKTVAAGCCHFYHLGGAFSASRIEAGIEDAKLVLTLCE